MWGGGVGGGGRGARAKVVNLLLECGRYAVEFNVRRKLLQEEESLFHFDVGQDDVDPAAFVPPFHNEQAVDANSLELVACCGGVANDGNLMELHKHGDAIGGPS